MKAVKNNTKSLYDYFPKGKIFYHPKYSCELEVIDHVQKSTCGGSRSDRWEACKACFATSPSEIRPAILVRRVDGGMPPSAGCLCYSLWNIVLSPVGVEIQTPQMVLNGIFDTEQ